MQVRLIESQNLTFFKFNKLKERFAIDSLDDYFEKFLIDLKFDIICEAAQIFETISNRNKLNCLIGFFKQIANFLEQFDKPHIGSNFKLKSFDKCFPKEKEKMIDKETISKSKYLEDDLKTKNWYALDSFCGTDQEMFLIEFIRTQIPNLIYKYDKVQLLRNEEVYKIYNFVDGEGFQPDFLLLMKGKNMQQSFYYQIFIEPKQEKYISTNSEKWKQEFMQEISKRYGFENSIILANKNYLLFGTPFYNSEEQQRTIFAEDFAKYIKEI